MKKRTKIIFVISAIVVLSVLTIVLKNTVFKDPPIIPPEIESVLVYMVDVEDGELLTKEELGAFWDEFDGGFEGYYDTMPDCLRELTTTFAERMSARYRDEIPQSFPNFSPYHIFVSLDKNMITFQFRWNDFGFEYMYNEKEFGIKTTTCYIPHELKITQKNLSEKEIFGVPVYSINNKLCYIVYSPAMVNMYVFTPQGSGSYTINSTRSVLTADFDAYMRAVKAGEPGADNPGDKLSLDRIEKHMAAKRK